MRISSGTRWPANDLATEPLTIELVDGVFEPLQWEGVRLVS
jgi:hypothetical protein